MIWHAVAGTVERERIGSSAGTSAPDAAGESVAVLQAETEFELPRGFVDAEGVVHRDGRMRLATARDELTPLVDARVARNRAYLVVLLLSRVITRLGTLSAVTPEVIEGLYPADFGYLQRLYRQLNLDPLADRPACPSCGAPLPLEVASLGGAPATPHA